MASIMDLIIEYFRNKTASRKQYLDDEIKKSLDAMALHHAYYVGELDKIETLIGDLIKKKQEKTNDIDDNLIKICEYVAEFMSNFRKQEIYQDKTIAEIRELLDFRTEIISSQLDILTDLEKSAIMNYRKAVLSYFYNDWSGSHRLAVSIAMINNASDVILNADGSDNLMRSIELLWQEIPTLRGHIVTDWRSINTQYARLRKLYFNI